MARSRARGCSLQSSSKRFRIVSEIRERTPGRPSPAIRSGKSLGSLPNTLLNRSAFALNQSEVASE
eukprot:1703266-Prymnesium_polylepis.1